MTAALTVPEAAKVARIEDHEIREALASGDLRSLDRRHVEAWARARIAGVVTRSQQP